MNLDLSPCLELICMAVEMVFFFLIMGNGGDEGSMGI